MNPISSVLHVLVPLLLLVLVTTPVNATGCRSVIVHRRGHVVDHVVHHQKIVTAAVVVPAVVTPLVQAVTVPLYSSYYNPYLPVPPGQGTANLDPGLTESIRTLTGEVRNLSDRVNRVEVRLGGGDVPRDPPPPRQPPRDPFNPMPGVQDGGLLTLTTTHCAKCHDSTNAAAAGKGFVMLQGGKLRQLTAEDLGAVIVQVSSGTMPKGGKMSEKDRLQMIALLVAK